MGRVFDHWRQALNHPKAVLDPKRAAAIERALKNYSVDELCRAVDGCKASPHHMGQNNTGQRYDDIELIVRDAKHVEQFLQCASAPPAPGVRGPLFSARVRPAPVSSDDEFETEAAARMAQRGGR